MLTIRHVEDSGRERIFTVVSLERTPEGHLVLGEVITSGKVYVMNDAGKTVGVYDCNKK